MISSSRTTFLPFGLKGWTKGRMEKMAASIRGERRAGSLEGEETSTLFLPRLPQTKITRINVKGGERMGDFSL